MIFLLSRGTLYTGQKSPSRDLAGLDWIGFSACTPVSALWQISCPRALHIIHYSMDPFFRHSGPCVCLRPVGGRKADRPHQNGWSCSSEFGQKLATFNVTFRQVAYSSWGSFRNSKIMETPVKFLVSVLV
jgi:hypothetical protein